MEKARLIFSSNSVATYTLRGVRVGQWAKTSIRNGHVFELRCRVTSTLGRVAVAASPPFRLYSHHSQLPTRKAGPAAAAAAAAAAPAAALASGVMKRSASSDALDDEGHHHLAPVVDDFRAKKARGSNGGGGVGNTEMGEDVAMVHGWMPSAPSLSLAEQRDVLLARADELRARAAPLLAEEAKLRQEAERLHREARRMEAGLQRKHVPFKLAPVLPRVPDWSKVLPPRIDATAVAAALPVPH